MTDTTDPVAASLAETNRMLTEVTWRLDLLGSEIGAALNVAAGRARRTRRIVDANGCLARRFGDSAGRSHEEVVAILGRFGHTLPA